MEKPQVLREKGRREKKVSASKACASSPPCKTSGGVKTGGTEGGTPELGYRNPKTAQKALFGTLEGGLGGNESNGGLGSLSTGTELLSRRKGGGASQKSRGKGGHGRLRGGGRFGLGGTPKNHTKTRHMSGVTPTKEGGGTEVIREHRQTEKTHTRWAKSGGVGKSK